MRLTFFCVFSIFALMVVGAAAQLSVPFVSPMFGDNMVLQRGKPMRFWGWAKSGESIQIELNGRTAKTLTGPDGRWQAEIKSPPPGGPYMVRTARAEQNTDDFSGTSAERRQFQSLIH
jgi:sialate O-acetylesterase